MKPRRATHLGMSLVELLIAVGIATTLLGLAAPGFLGWIQNAQVRATAEAIDAGLHLARTEALRRNALVRFQFTSTLDNNCALSTTVGNWVVSRDDPTGACGSAASETTAPRIVQSRPAAEGGTNAVVAVGAQYPTAHFISFNGLGRVSPQPTSDITIDVSNPTAGVCAANGGTVRCLRLTVSPWGQTRMCDPALSSGDPQAC